jgi:hypothetical protein
MPYRIAILEAGDADPDVGESAMAVTLAHRYLGAP